MKREVDAYSRVAARIFARLKAYDADERARARDVRVPLSARTRISTLAFITARVQ